MKSLRKCLALGFIAFWVVMTNHCALEVIPGLDFLACAPHSETDSHQPSDCGDEGDACATVESGSYKSEESQVTAGKAPWATAFLMALLSDLTPLNPLAGKASLEVIPPELAHTWQFSSRTALPPRAPSILS